MCQTVRIVVVGAIGEAIGCNTMHPSFTLSTAAWPDDLVQSPPEPEPEFPSPDHCQKNWWGPLPRAEYEARRAQTA